MSGPNWVTGLTDQRTVPLSPADPKLRLSYYTDMIRGLKERFPHVHIKALTAVEIRYGAMSISASRGRTSRARPEPGTLRERSTVCR